MNSKRSRESSGRFAVTIRCTKCGKPVCYHDQGGCVQFIPGADYTFENGAVVCYDCATPESEEEK